MKFREAVFKKGGTLPALEIVVGQDGYDGFTTDPTGATVKFNMVLRSDHATYKVTAAAGSIQDISLLDDGTYQATLVYAWILADRDTVKQYDGEYEVTIGADIIHIPTGEVDEDLKEIRKYIPISIVESLS